MSCVPPVIAAIEFKGGFATAWVAKTVSFGHFDLIHRRNHIPRCFPPPLVVERIARRLCRQGCVRQICRHNGIRQSNVAGARFGSLADIGQPIRDVRFTPESRHVQRRNRCLLCANSGHVESGDDPAVSPKSRASIQRIQLVVSKSMPSKV